MEMMGIKPEASYMQSKCTTTALHCKTRYLVIFFSVIQNACTKVSRICSLHICAYATYVKLMQQHNVFHTRRAHSIVVAH